MSPHSKRPKPLADLIETCLGPTIARQGFTRADILVSWPEIVGERLADHSQPLKIEWPRRPRSEAPGEPSTLVVRVESAFALELQHLAPLILERVNGFYGWRCVGRLVLKQGPVRRARPAEPKPAEIGAEDRARIAASLDGIGEDNLRQALGRLGTAIVQEKLRGSDGQDTSSVPQSPAAPIS